MKKINIDEKEREILKDMIYNNWEVIYHPDGAGVVLGTMKCGIIDVKKKIDSKIANRMINKWLIEQKYLRIATIATLTERAIECIVDLELIKRAARLIEKHPKYPGIEPAYGIISLEECEWSGYDPCEDDFLTIDIPSLNRQGVSLVCGKCRGEYISEARELLADRELRDECGNIIDGEIETEQAHFTAKEFLGCDICSAFLEGEVEPSMRLFKQMRKLAERPCYTSFELRCLRETIRLMGDFHEGAGIVEMMAKVIIEKLGGGNEQKTNIR